MARLSLQWDQQFGSLRSATRKLVVMTNAPENVESYVLPGDVEKLEYAPDPKVPKSSIFELEREDYTLANLVLLQFFRDQDVVFIGYKHPHPIQDHITLRVQTAAKPATGDVYSPIAAVDNTSVNVTNEFRSWQDQVQS